MRKIDLNKESDFENLKNTNCQVRISQSKFYWAVENSIQEHDCKTMVAIQNQRVLEIGCSNGSAAEQYALVCQYYLGVDISDVAIDLARRRNLENAIFECADGHYLPADDRTFDVVIVNSLLHHLDLGKVLVEIERVLVAEGKLIFREPLGTNPLFQLYRLLTPSARTPDEKPLEFSDIKLMQSYFELKEISFFGFLNILSAFSHNDYLRSILTACDRLLARTPLKYFFWQFAGFATKRRLDR